MNFNMKKIIILLMLLCVANLTDAQTFYNVTALNTVNTPKVDYTDVQTWSSVGAIFNVSGSISTASDGVSANWKEGYDHSPISLNYTNPTLTLTRQDGTTLTTTIDAGGGDFVPIAGNLGNPMTGPLVVKRIEPSATQKPIVIGVNSNLNEVGNNVSIGEFSGYGLASGATDNVLLGYIAGAEITTGIENLAIGSGSLSSTTTGSSNIGIGAYNGINFTTGSDNIFLGNGAGSFDGGNYNSSIFIGKRAGRLTSSDNTIEIGNAPNNGNTCVIEGIGSGISDNDHIRINGKFYVRGWQFKQVTTGLNIYYNDVFKARIGTDGDLYLSGTTVHYNATE